MTETRTQVESHFSDYVDIVQKRAGIIFGFFLTVVIVTAIGTFLMAPVYCAKTTLLINMESPNVLTTSGMVTMDTQQYYAYKEYYQSQAEILTSLSITKRVFDEFGLEKQIEFSKAQEPVKKFLKTIKVVPVTDTRLLELQVYNEDPVLAAKIANRIAEIYINRNLYYISRDELTNLLKNEYLKLEAKLSEATKVYKEKHPVMIRLRQEMRDMSEKIDNIRKAKFEFDIFTEEDLKGGYKDALQCFKENNVIIQDPAEVPVIPVKPKKMVNIFLAMVVGLLGGLVIAFFCEYMDDTVKTVDDILHITRKPFLGSIPDISRMTGKMSEQKRSLLVHQRPKDPVSEAYRAIRTSIFFSFSDENPLKSLVVTSPGPREGKTTTICNLAAAMAQSGKRVLLVDADMRKPRIHNVFGVPNETGLSQYLQYRAVYEDIVKPTDIANLFFTAAGKNPPNPSELISSGKMKEFIAAASREFECVLFDTPPVAVVTDAVILSQLTNGLALVLESGKTSKRVMPKIVGILDEAKINVIGLVINKIVIHRGNPYYYYYSQYYGK